MIQPQDAGEKALVDELRSREAEELAQILSAKYQIPYIDLSKIAINTDALRLIDEEEARAGEAVAFKIAGKTLFVALRSPRNEKAQAIVKDLQNKNFLVNSYICSEAGLKRVWERYKEISLSRRAEAGVIDVSSQEINDYTARFKNLDGIKQLLADEGQRALKHGGISSLLEIILAGGLVTQASDIHTEPQEEQVRMRYRLDGVLQDIIFFDHRLYRQLLSRVKLVSGLKLNVRRVAQDGRFTIRLRSTEIEIRTSVLPGAYGETIVLRILNPETISFTFETLGVEPHLLRIMEQEISKPNGMVLLTGPTGSGKTTTLYAFLRRVSTPGNKIITIEDPIEYHLPGVNQTQVDRAKDYTFLSGLRAALRQDPDIIMVGEIRDSETAGIAINASLTGHLVFSTLHTNNAAGTIPRLIDLDANPKVIDAALNIAVAQRLVRLLCPDCRREDAPTAEEKAIIEAVTQTIRQKRPDIEIPPTGRLWRQGNGCDACHHTGYRGRQGVFEAILMDNKVASLLQTNPSEREIKIAAKPQGILDMREDGILKVLRGSTTLDELDRVVDINEEII